MFGCFIVLHSVLESSQYCNTLSLPIVSRNFVSSWLSSTMIQYKFHCNLLLCIIQYGRGSIVVRAHASHAEGLRFEPYSIP